MKILSAMILILFVSQACTTSHPRQEQERADETLGAGLMDAALPPGGSRPVDVKTPQGFDSKSGKKYPLLVLLHGYGSSAAQQDRYLGLSAEALRRGYVFAAPNGTVSGSHRRFWNASESCCNFEATTVDDVAYLRSLIEEITTRYAIDPQRVYLFGHSNGAFMAYRMACDASFSVTAVAGLAGSMRSDPQSCKPERPVSVLAIHGTKDHVVSYRGGSFSRGGAAYPAAEETIARWAEVNGCQPEPVISEPFPLLKLSRKPETRAMRYSACREGVRTELWKIEGGSHIPLFTREFVPKVFDFFERK